jgi:hypothetical protein
MVSHLTNDKQINTNGLYNYIMSVDSFTSHANNGYAFKIGSSNLRIFKHLKVFERLDIIWRSIFLHEEGLIQNLFKINMMTKFIANGFNGILVYKNSWLSRTNIQEKLSCTPILLVSVIFFISIIYLHERSYSRLWWLWDGKISRIVFSFQTYPNYPTLLL